MAGVTSRRRGAPSMEKDKVERRAWYDDLRAINEKAKIPDKNAELMASLLGGAGGGGSVPGFMDALNLADSLAEMGKDSEEDAGKYEEQAEECRRAPVASISRWMYELNKPTSPVARLICFHGIGCSYLFFQNWADYFACVGVQVYAICLPGRLQRFKDERVSAAEAGAQIGHGLLGLLGESGDWGGGRSEHERALPSLPIFLFGHCLGGIVAFEVARLLGDKVVRLIVSGVKAPAVLTAINKDRFGTKYFCSSDAELMERLKVLDILSDLLRDKRRRDLLHSFLPNIRADYTMLEKYVYKPGGEKAGSLTYYGSICCPITVLVALDDKTCAPHTELREWHLETVQSMGPECLYEEFHTGGHGLLKSEKVLASIFSYLEALALGHPKPVFLAQHIDSDDGF